MSWRAVVRGCSCGLLLLPLWGCSWLERRSVVHNQGAPETATSSRHVTRQTKTPAESAGGFAGDRDLMLTDEQSGGREDLQPVKAETKAVPPEPDAPKLEGPKLDAPKPDAPKPPAKEKEPQAPPVKTAPKAANAANAANAPGGIAPAHHAGEGGPMLPPLEDPHVRPTPTAMGSVMQLPPGESPVERALELTKRVDMLTAEKKSLHLRICALEEAMQAASKQMTTVTRQVEDAGTEVTRARKDLQTWAEDMREQQGRLRQQEKENQELLKMVIATLEKMLGPEAAPQPKPAPGAGS